METVNYKGYGAFLILLLLFANMQRLVLIPVSVEVNFAAETSEKVA